MRLSINPRGSAYIRGPKIGPIRTRVHLASVSASKKSSKQGRGANLSAANREIEKGAVVVNGLQTMAERVGFRQGVEESSPGIAKTIRDCGWYWDIDGFLRRS